MKINILLVFVITVALIMQYHSMNIIDNFLGWITVIVSVYGLYIENK